MKNNDNGMGELLCLLRAHPELIEALVFDATRVRRLLRSQAARRLIVDPKTRAFLRYVSGPTDAASIALCLGGTNLLCSGGSKFVLPCPGGTKPPPQTTRPPCR
jgi:hypothetical protein